MKINDKHKSKLQKGFAKQVTRQDLKPSYVKIKVLPIVLSWNHKSGSYKPLKQRFWNNKWNGMNLKNLYNSFTVLIVGGMYGKFTINGEGKYKLSIHGKQLLKKKRAKKIQNLTQ